MYASFNLEEGDDDVSSSDVDVTEIVILPQKTSFYEGFNIKNVFSNS